MEALLVAHTTLLEISCTGSYILSAQNNHCTETVLFEYTQHNNYVLGSELRTFISFAHLSRDLHILISSTAYHQGIENMVATAAKTKNFKSFLVKSYLPNFKIMWLEWSWSEPLPKFLNYFDLSKTWPPGSRISFSYPFTGKP